MSVSEFDQTTVDIYRAWQASDPEAYIVDCDTAPQAANPFIFENVDQVRFALEHQLESIPSDTPQVLIDKLTASHLFLMVSEYGQEMDYLDYVKGTMGITPVMFPEAELEAQAVELDDRLKDYGLGWDRDFRRAYKKQFEIDDYGPDFLKRFEHVSAWSTGKIRSYIAGNPLIVEPEPVDTEHYQAATVSDDDGNLHVEVSTNKASLWTPGLIAENVVHESTHGAQIHHWKQQIEQGTLEQTHGIITPHTPEMTQLETLALTLSFIALSTEVDSPDYTLQAVLSPYYFSVISNAHTMVNQGFSIDKCVAYVQERIPFETRDILRRRLKYRREDPVERTYYASYGTGVRLAKPVLALAEAEQRVVLHQLFDAPLTANQIEATIAA